MSTNTHPPITGTISHGTLREQDLLPAFLGALEELDPAKARELADEVGHAVAALDAALEAEDPEEGFGAFENAGWLLERLDDAINAALPHGWSFGAHEGDGSDFGVWWGWDDDEPEQGPCILTEADILAGRDEDCTMHAHEGDEDLDTEDGMV